MAISPAFTVSNPAIAVKNVIVTDTSTGTYGTITQRRVYVQDAFANYLTGDGTVNYTAWALANLSISLTNILTGNTAANIKVEWCDVSGNVVQTLNSNYPLSQAGKQFLFYLVQLQGLTPGIYQDTNYSGNLALLWTNIIGGDNAVTDGNDIAGAQNCYSRANEMQQNQSKYF